MGKGPPPSYSVYKDVPLDYYRIELEGVAVRVAKLRGLLDMCNVADDALIRLGKHLYQGPEGRPLTEEAPEIESALAEAAVEELKNAERRKRKVH